MTALLVRERMALYGPCSECGKARDVEGDTVQLLFCPYGPDHPVVRCGAWYQLGRFMVLTCVADSDHPYYVLDFDPANLLFLDGGVRIRVEGFDTPRPTLAVAHWKHRDRIERFPLRRHVDLRKYR